MTVQQAIALALQCYRAGRLGEAESIYRQVLAAYPDQENSLHMLGMIAFQRHQLEDAAKLLSRACAVNPHSADYHNNLGLVWTALGKWDEAIAACRRALQLKPDSAEVLNNLGNALKEKGLTDEAVAVYRKALQHRADLAEIHNNLGTALRDQGHIDEAQAAFQTALRLKPQFADASNNLATVLQSKGQVEAAIAACQMAIRLRPEYAEAHNNLGGLLKEQGHLEPAMMAFQTALKLKPDFAGAWNNLGNALKDLGQLDRAAEAFQTALRIKPDFAEAFNDLGNVLKDRGQVALAIESYREAVRRKPNDDKFRSNVIFGLHFQADVDEAEIRREQAEWNRQHVVPLRPVRRPLRNSPDPHRRLRIGYVSPDFRTHATSFFVAPLLEAHDRAQFEIHCYASVRRPDAVTERLRRSSNAWHDVGLLSDAELAERIKEDEIDILIDLSMHTSAHRLLTFARKPAPLQGSWLAYAGSSGVETIDFRITDAVIEPNGSRDAGPGEQIVRLRDCWCCYAPLGEFPLPGSLPAAESGSVTFGSLNQFGKVGEATLRHWAELLAMVPNSRLLMVCPRGEATESTRRFFAARGVPAPRLELVAPAPWDEYIRLFNRVDIALDSFPFNGMTTTCHALWMGVPVVTRAGAMPVARTGLSLLRTVGLSEWAASNEREYLGIAAKAAGDFEKLSDLRAGLRSRMQASPLMDGRRFAEGLESAYREMWRRWCEARS